MTKSSEEALEVIESLVHEIRHECKNGRQRCLRQLSITLKEMKEAFDLLRKEGR